MTTKTSETKVMTDRLLTNIVTSPNMLSVRFVGVLTALWGIWSLIPHDSQQGLIASLNIPTAWLPVLAAVGLYLTRIWPQANLPGPPQTLTDAVEPGDPLLADTQPAEDHDAEWLEAIQTVYPAMAEAQLERLRKVRALVRQKSLTPQP